MHWCLLLCTYFAVGDSLLIMLDRPTMQHLQRSAAEPCTTKLTACLSQCERSW